MTDKSIKLVDFEAMIAEAYALDDEIATIKRETLAPKQARLDELEGKILQTLTDHEMTSYRSSHGLVVKSLRYSVRVPKDAEAKAALFGWLKDKGEEVYYQYVTVNSQSLNALYKAEMEAAKEAGDFDFKLPGVGDPEATPTLSRRKK